jgi:hypothetical protein
MYPDTCPVLPLVYGHVPGLHKHMGLIFHLILPPQKKRAL